jgi:putative transposase
VPVFVGAARIPHQQAPKTENDTLFPSGFHFLRNLLCRVPKSAQGLVATLVRSIFAQPDAASTWAQHARIVEQLEGRFPAAAELLAEAAGELLAFTAFPKEHWRQIWSNNPQERLNKELRRRTDVVGIFPNRDAVVRLVGAVLGEQHDEWAIARRYMSAESLAKTRVRVIDGEREEEPRELAAAG